MVGGKPYLRKLPVTDVWLDSGLTQTCQGYKKMSFKKSVYWLHDVVGSEGPNNWKFLTQACWKSAFVLHVIGVH